MIDRGGTEGWGGQGAGKKRLVMGGGGKGSKEGGVRWPSKTLKRKDENRA